MAMAIKIVLILALILAALWAFVLLRAQLQERRAVAAYPPDGQIIEVNGHKVHAVVIGDGPDLVLIHGSSGSTRDMTFEFARRLAENYRVIVFDRPGLGYSDRLSPTGATIKQQATVLSQAAQQLGAMKPIVLGHSYGGSVALAWAVYQPGHIAGLVVLSGAAIPWDTGLSRHYQRLSHPIIGPLVIPFFTAFVHNARVEREVSSIFTPQTAPAGYAHYIAPGLTLRRNSLRANALQRANLLAEVTAMSPLYGAISVPAEIVHGTDDEIVGAQIHAVPLSHLIPDAKLILLQGIGHMPHHTNADQVIARIDSLAIRAGLRPAP